MSGGVDSSVAALLLRGKGHQLIGVTMRIWDGGAPAKEGTHHGCYGAGEEEDIEDASKVAKILGIPFYTIDLGKEYRSEVLDYFCREYLSGRTPNPCIRCNRQIKFDALVQRIRDIGIEFDYLATGHYANVGYDKDHCRYLLRKARDLTKDQSYFLFALSQEQLGLSLFPLGGYTKTEIRKIASENELGIDDKAESQNFINGGYSVLIEEMAKPGPVLDNQGNVLGQHRGIPFYTIGQRRGLGISRGEPLYVTAIDLDRNAIIVGGREAIYGDELIASNLNWIAIEELKQPVEAKVKIRYLSNGADAKITSLDKDEINVKFREPQKAITPGQAVVFYDGDIVLGGGTIERAVNNGK
jgi:tRNA-specific 2-thiouridylase